MNYMELDMEKLRNGNYTVDDLIAFLDSWERDAEGRYKREEAYRQAHKHCDNCKYSDGEYCEYWDYMIADNNICREWK